MEEAGGRVRVWCRRRRRKRVLAFPGGSTGRDVRRKRGRVGSCAYGSQARRRRRRKKETEERRGAACPWTGPGLNKTIGCASAYEYELQLFFHFSFC
jgi:hypothetical protein